MPAQDIQKIAFIGNYVPRCCGIATFTRDLRCAVAGHLPDTECLVVPMNDHGQAYDYPAEVRFVCSDGDIGAFHRAAEFLNLANVDVVSLQHEYGIFGGPAGANVLGLLGGLRSPVHTTLHTVLAEPAADQRRVMAEVIRLSARLVVMTERGRSLLEEVYGVPRHRIDVIPHGIPDMPFVDPNFHKDRFGMEGASVLLTFGLLSPNKGIEHMLQALPGIVARFPNTVYVVLGATHPHLLREQGEDYRGGLEQLAKTLGVEKHVVFDNRFVDMAELLEFIGATDIYVTPYLGRDQITSGTLAYAFGCGKAVLSTPYWHAAELLGDGRGVIVPFRDSEALTTEVCGLLEDDARRHAMRKRAYMLGREMVWSRVAERYVESFRKARRPEATRTRRGSVSRAPRGRVRDLPPIKLDHLWRLTDSTGVFQHAAYDIPRFAEGYCTDDNARALLLMVLLEDLGIESPRIDRATSTYAAFLGHAFVRDTGRFRNFLGFDRRWLDDGGSDDCLGRAIVALGACVGRSRNQRLQRWAIDLFEPALRAAEKTTSPRAWALAIVGIQEYLRRLSGDRLVAEWRESFTLRLMELNRANATVDWPWFEDVVAYENARPCQALILSGRWMKHDDALRIGLGMLEWLSGVQRSPAGLFRPVGCRGFFHRGGEPAIFDQQPIEAHAVVAASIEAFHAVGDPRWLESAWQAFDWFHGGNDVGIGLVDPRTGGCRDGLLEDRANENQGAESTISYLTALAEMKLLASSLAGPLAPAHGGTETACRSSARAP